MIATLFCVGIVAAMQVGKVAIATPQLQRELGLSFGQIGWVLGAYATLGAMCALQFSLVVRAHRPRSMVILGLCLIALGNVIGMVAGGLFQILLSRLIEGTGFLIIAVVIPVMLARLTPENNQNLIISVWAAYMPAGIALVMLAAPFMETLGWRTVWALNSMVATACIVATLLFVPHIEKIEENRASYMNALRDVLSDKACLLATLVYAFYTVQYFALVGFLPSMITSQFGIGATFVGLIAAVAVAANGVGNILTGLLLRRSIAFWLPTCGAFILLASLPLGFLSGQANLAQIVGLAVLWMLAGGILPASVLSSAPKLARSTSMTAIVVGLFLQGSNIGQLAGPPLFGWWIENFGWHAGYIYFLAVSSIGLATALLLLRQAPDYSQAR